MADRASEQLLASFADQLLRNQLTDERHGRFMIHWVRRYLVHRRRCRMRRQTN